MYVLYCLVDESTEEHSVRPDRHELQLFIELILPRTGLIDCDI